jgi:hypothetical protein
MPAGSGSSGAPRARRSSTFDKRRLAEAALAQIFPKAVSDPGLDVDEVAARI